jgi:hypothetical protein
MIRTCAGIEKYIFHLDVMGLSLWHREDVAPEVFHEIGYQIFLNRMIDTRDHYYILTWAMADPKHLICAVDVTSYSWPGLFQTPMTDPKHLK